jgi:hypothetical protein
MGTARVWDVESLPTSPTKVPKRPKEPEEPAPEKPLDEQAAVAENAALKAVKALGGRVTVDAEQPGLPVVAVDFGKTQITDADLKLLKELKNLQTLHLYDAQVTDAGLKELKAALPELRINP